MNAQIPSDFPRLPQRDPRGHKGTFGTVSIVGGCCTSDQIMAGAPALTALGSLRSGAGVARVVVPREVSSIVLSVCPSATCIVLPTTDLGQIIVSDACAVLDGAAGSSSCLVIGPGMGSDPAVAILTLRALQQAEIPVVVDADALNALATIPNLHLDLRAPAILTPHPGEFRRLAAALRITADPTSESSRPSAAEQLAQRLGAIVVLKGAGTIVTNGIDTWRCPSGHPALATAGSGDVLAGVIAGLVAQHVRLGPARAGAATPGLALLDAVRIGVLAHGLAAERWAASRQASAGLLASELATELPQVFAGL